MENANLFLESGPGNSKCIVRLQFSAPLARERLRHLNCNKYCGTAAVDIATLSLHAMYIGIFHARLLRMLPKNSDWSWPRSWADRSLLQLYSHRNARANSHRLGHPSTGLARTMRLDLSGPLLESLTGKRQYFFESAAPLSPNARLGLGPERDDAVGGLPLGPRHGRRPHTPGPRTKIVQGWPKLRHLAPGTGLAQNAPLGTKFSRSSLLALSSTPHSFPSDLL
jgi:hypothetical protein